MYILSGQNYFKNRSNDRNNHAPSFEAKFVSEPEAKELFKKDLLDTLRNDRFSYQYCHPDNEKYSEQPPINFDKFYNKLTKMVEKATKRIKGTIILTYGPSNKNPDKMKPYIIYKTPEGCIYDTLSDLRSHKYLYSSDVLPHVSPRDKPKPQIDMILSDLAELEEENSGSNEFRTLYDKLFDTEIY